MAAETFNQRLEQLAQQYINSGVVDLTTTIAAGKLTHEDYKYTAGKIAGLNLAKEFLAAALVKCQQH